MSIREIKTDIRIGDCLKVLKEFPDNFFDLIIASPPYADSRSKTYGGIKPENNIIFHYGLEMIRNATIDIS